MYAAAARWRRRWYARHPEAQRRLQRPVISVGNLTIGGSGKTPLVAYLARVLRDLGHRPAILSRGYRRRVAADGVIVVRDAHRVLADLDRAGDEPLMLARALDGVIVAVSPNRWTAGRLAELHLGATVHLLDDGFQHLSLRRDVDLLVVGRDDLAAHVLPRGRLREPIDAARAAHALLVPDVSAPDAEAIAQQIGVAHGFAVRRLVAGPPDVDARAIGAPVLAVAGIARPQRFFDDLRASGWTVGGTLAYRDHHAYRAADVDAIAARARAAGAVLVATTEKDLVRLLPHRPFPVPIVGVPLRVEVDPAGGFRAWLEPAVS